ncbi:uncharacterized protein LOC119169213 isoform X5 [Rhipicephalus microplus]|uniref:uncharacterized protein LOC119169213 isoform X5 n=1 Tax=Rhipicephalus microplus TaxID=6941 RepID=UPI003F6A68D5
MLEGRQSVVAGSRRCWWRTAELQRFEVVHREPIGQVQQPCRDCGCVAASTGASTARRCSRATFDRKLLWPTPSSRVASSVPSSPHRALPKLYQEQQAQALERLRLRTARDQDALWHIIVSKSGGQEQVSAGRVTSVKQRPMAPQMSDVKCRVAAQLEGEMFQLDGFEEDEAAFPSSEEEHSDGVADHSQNAMFWLWVLQMTATAVAAVPSMSLCDTVPTRFRWTCPGGGLVMMTTRCGQVAASRGNFCNERACHVQINQWLIVCCGARPDWCQHRSPGSQCV